MRKKEKSSTQKDVIIDKGKRIIYWKTKYITYELMNPIKK